MKKALVILGSPASGKTRLAHQIASTHSKNEVVYIEDPASKTFPWALITGSRPVKLVIVESSTDFDQMLGFYKGINHTFDKSNRPAPSLVFTSQGLKLDQKTYLDLQEHFEFVEINQPRF